MTTEARDRAIWDIVQGSKGDKQPYSSSSINTHKYPQDEKTNFLTLMSTAPTPPLQAAQASWAAIAHSLSFDLSFRADASVSLELSRGSFFFFFFGRVKTGKPAQSKCTQMLYSVGLDLVRPTKNPRYLNLSGFPTKVEFQSCDSQFLGRSRGSFTRSSSFMHTNWV